MAELQSRGVAFPAPVVDGGAERIAHFADPNGTALYLFQQVGR
jgi:hypothetical protein